VLRGRPHGLRAHAAQNEQDLPQRRLDEADARDQPGAPERRREREDGRPLDDGPVEVKERRAVQETSGSVRVNPPARLPSTACAIAAISSVPGGRPSSHAAGSEGSSATEPRSGTPSSVARRSPPPLPNTSERMFSTTPTIRMPVFCAIVAAREAT